MVLEKTLESPLDYKEIQPVHPKGDQSWMSIGRTDAEAETPILWPPDAKKWLMRKNPDAGKGWRQEEKGTTVDEIVGWHHRLYQTTWPASWEIFMQVTKQQLELDTEQQTGSKLGKLFHGITIINWQRRKGSTWNLW